VAPSRRAPGARRRCRVLRRNSEFIGFIAEPPRTCRVFSPDTDRLGTGSSMDNVMGLMRAESLPPLSPTKVETFEELYRRHVGEVYSYAASRVGRDEAEDITADVFHAAARAVVHGDSGEITPAWLMTVTRNKVIDHWRRRERRHGKLHLLRAIGNTVDPSDRVIAAAESHRVVLALEKVSKRHRMLLMMHYVDGLTAPELAGLLGLTTVAIESALARARRSFRSHFDHSGGGDEPR
jgi:RNA polymerase sigma-70 factor (ECF subfamily)